MPCVVAIENNGHVCVVDRRRERVHTDRVLSSVKVLSFVTQRRALDKYASVDKLFVSTIPDSDNPSSLIFEIG